MNSSINALVRRAYFENAVITRSSRIGSKSPIVAQHLKEADTIFEVTGLTEEIDSARDALNRREFQTALLILNRILQRDDFGTASAHEHFRISSNLGTAEFGLGHPEAAADHFLEAFRWEPTDERAQTNEVFAYIIKGDNDTAKASPSQGDATVAQEQNCSAGDNDAEAQAQNREALPLASPGKRLRKPNEPAVCGRLADWA